jgi:hypothetical protein
MLLCFVRWKNSQIVSQSARNEIEMSKKWALTCRVEQREQNEGLLFINNEWLAYNKWENVPCYYLMIMSFYGKMANLEAGMQWKRVRAAQRGHLFLVRFLVRNKIHDPSVGTFVNRRTKQERAFGLWWREVATLANKETTKGWRRDVRWLKLSSMIVLMSCELRELKPFFKKKKVLSHFRLVFGFRIWNRNRNSIQTTMYNVRRCCC